MVANRVNRTRRIDNSEIRPIIFLSPDIPLGKYVRRLLLFDLSSTCLGTETYISSIFYLLKNIGKSIRHKSI